MKKVITSALSLLLLTGPVFAASPPSSCKLDSTSGMSVTGTPYVALNKSVRFTSYELLPINHTATHKFSTSEKGQVGSQSHTNIHSISTSWRYPFNVIFNSPSSRGNEQVWAESSRGKCVYKNVVVHNAPTVNISSAEHGLGSQPLRLAAQGVIDSLSKNGQSGIGEQYSWTFINVSAPGIPPQTVNTGNTNSITHYPQYNGEYRVRISVSDGTYSDTDDTFLFFNGGQDGPNPLF